ncbi:hypothetical protein DWUX_1245 [Desulfovibrio diazotrophicus]|nr:hypothetical protein DWUX_1245 [Desulfovibrio diazotrophicus]
MNKSSLPPTPPILQKTFLLSAAGIPLNGKQQERDGDCWTAPFLQGRSCPDQEKSGA